MKKQFTIKGAVDGWPVHTVKTDSSNMYAGKPVTIAIYSHFASKIDIKDTSE